MSSGSLSTVVDMMTAYGIGWIWSGNPWSLISKTHSIDPVSSPLLSKIFGYRRFPGLGMVTTSFLAICNESIAQRSANLQIELYGSSFNLHEYLPIDSWFRAVLVHYPTLLGLLLLALSPIRWLLKKLIPSPGTGPDLAAAGVERQTFTAVGIPKSPEGTTVKATLHYEGSLYYCSALMGVEAASLILVDDDTPAHRYGGGILTPATLGMAYVEKLRKAGIKFNIESLA